MITLVINYHNTWYHDIGSKRFEPRLSSVHACMCQCVPVCVSVCLFVDLCAYVGLLYSADPGVD